MNGRREDFSDEYDFQEVKQIILLKREAKIVIYSEFCKLLGRYYYPL